MQNPASSDCPCDTTAVRCTEGGRPLLRQGDHAHLQEQQSLGESGVGNTVKQSHLDWY